MLISIRGCFFLSVAYLLGHPVLGYSLDVGKEHVNLIDERLEKLIYSGQLDEKELDRYNFVFFHFIEMLSSLKNNIKKFHVLSYSVTEEQKLQLQ